MLDSTDREYFDIAESSSGDHLCYNFSNRTISVGMRRRDGDRGSLSRNGWVARNFLVGLFVHFRPSCVACGSYFPDQGLNLCPLHWEQSFNHWTTRRVPGLFLETRGWLPPSTPSLPTSTLGSFSKNVTFLT